MPGWANLKGEQCYRVSLLFALPIPLLCSSLAPPPLSPKVHAALDGLEFLAARVFSPLSVRITAVSPPCLLLSSFCYLPPFFSPTPGFFVVVFKGLERSLQSHVASSPHTGHSTTAGKALSAQRNPLLGCLWMSEPHDSLHRRSVGIKGPQEESWPWSPGKAVQMKKAGELTSSHIFNARC